MRINDYRNTFFRIAIRIVFYPFFSYLKKYFEPVQVQYFFLEIYCN